MCYSAVFDVPRSVLVSLSLCLSFSADIWTSVKQLRLPQSIHTNTHSILPGVTPHPLSFPNNTTRAAPPLSLFQEDRYEDFRTLCMRRQRREQVHAACSAAACVQLHLCYQPCLWVCVSMWVVIVCVFSDVSIPQPLIVLSAPPFIPTSSSSSSGQPFIMRIILKEKRTVGGRLYFSLFATGLKCALWDALMVSVL